MTALLLTLDPAVIGLALIVWTWAGMRVGSLYQATSPRLLRRRVTRLLLLVGFGVAAIAARAALTAGLAGAGWWFVQEKVVLGLPVVAVPAVAVLAVSVPRLLAVRRAAHALREVDVMAPSLRQQAAHPLLAWPIQVTAFGAAAAEVVFFVVAYPATGGSAFAVLTGVGIAAVVSWQRLRRRHARLGDAVVVPSRAARLVRSTGILTGLVALAVAVPITALAVAAPAAPEHADAGHGTLDLGGGPAGVHGSGPSIAVTELRGRRADEPVKSFTLTAQHAQVTLPSGEVVDALTYDGTLPGPELRVTEGDFVEVTLRNADIDEGVSLHWHGYDVPNGEDGVPGVTQEAVGVGQEFVYRFRADQVGTYWYHSHQNSYRQVTRGLYGVLVVAPRAQPAGSQPLDLTAAFHRLDDGPSTLSGSDEDRRREVAPGSRVRLRVVNASNGGQRFAVIGVDAVVAAVDGTDLNGPQPVRSPGLRLTAGGRADFVFTMPDSAVRLDTGGPRLLLAPPSGGAAPDEPATQVDLLHYGEPADTPFGAASTFDRDFTLVLDEKFARLGGVPTFAYTVNGNAYPEIPTQLVRFGDLVKFTFVARGYEAHPIHPHGHHVLILSINGVAPTGSPLWMDTFEVRPGDVVEVALRADNPGVWMDHCHDLRHAAEGMVFHLAYAGVTSPFRMHGE